MNVAIKLSQSELNKQQHPDSLPGFGNWVIESMIGVWSNSALPTNRTEQPHTER